ncbi:hypothetical protein ABZP36_024307 [Zizania latifolia]
MGRSPCCDQDAGVKKGPWTQEEDKQLLWSSIATKLPGRTDNEIKNYWNTHLRKKLLKKGIDPVTHQPRTDLNILAAGIPNLLAAANLGTSATTQPCSWDINAIKLQADAAKFQILQGLVRVLATATAIPTPAVPGFDLMALLAAAANGGGLVGQQHPESSVDQSRLAQYQYDGLLNDLPPLTTSMPPISKVLYPDNLLNSMVSGVPAGDGHLSSPEPIGHGGPSGSNRKTPVPSPPFVAEDQDQCNAAATPEDMSCEPTPASSPIDGANAIGSMNMPQDDDLIFDSLFWKETLQQISHGNYPTSEI